LANSQDSLSFPNQSSWRKWLSKHYDSSAGIWLVIAKKHTEGLHYDEAVEEALCYGWIDSTVNRLDDDHYKQWYSPRKPGGNWAESNKKRVARLIQENKMTDAGLQLIRQAQLDGSWDRLNQVENLEVPADLQAALAKNKKARENFERFAPSHKKQYIFWITQAKREETRRRRIDETIKLLTEGKKSRID